MAKVVFMTGERPTTEYTASGEVDFYALELDRGSQFRIAAVQEQRAFRSRVLTSASVPARGRTRNAAGQAPIQHGERGHVMTAKMEPLLPEPTDDVRPILDFPAETNPPLRDRPPHPVPEGVSDRREWRSETTAHCCHQKPPSGCLTLSPWPRP